MTKALPGPPLNGRTEPSRYALTGARVITSLDILTGHAVIVRDGRIEAVTDIGHLPHDLPRYDLDGGYLAPGFIDVHVHGAGGRGFNSGTLDDFRAIGRTLLKSGVTTALPSLASASIDQLSHDLETLAAVQATPDITRFHGAHLEGPYFAPEQRGAQSLESLRQPSDGTVDSLLEHADVITMMSFAPELPDAVSLTRRLINAQVIAAAGHSNGTIHDLIACQDAGLSHVIHVYSGQSTTTRQGAWRVPGILETTLASTELTVEIIADDKHLPPALMVIADRCLRGRLLAVSDASPGAGLPTGSVYHMGSQEYVVDDGVGLTLDGSSFGGSTTLLPHMLPILMHRLDITITDAVAMLTRIPAEAAKLTGVGAISPDYSADLVHLSDEYEVQSVALAGSWHSAIT